MKGNLVMNTGRIDWKKNLYIAWIGCFFTGASISLVSPFIAVYIEQLGTPASQVDLYSGLAVSVTALASAIVAPIWGGIADRKGRKIMMIRAAAGMTFTMGALAFVPNAFWLLFFRFLNGLLAGYIPNATAMVASQAPKEESGSALGTLTTGSMAGTLVGPLIGGLLSQWFGIENVFLITSVILSVTAILTIFFIKEDFTPVAKNNLISTKEIFQTLSRPSLLIGLFITTLTFQMCINTISPILTLFVIELSSDIENILFISGLITSIAGFSAFLSSSPLGKIGDRIGSQRVLLIGLVGTLLCIFPMTFVQTPFQLGALRFLLGFATGAIMPSINSLINRLIPREGISRIFSYNQMFANYGQVLGPLLGSSVAVWLGYRSVFLTTSLFIVLNITLVFFNFRDTFKEGIIKNRAGRKFGS